ncbi:MAG: aminotransferase class I/II-fold pyridoxal phosphate-dependent enzyme [Calditrichales bacterium]|nr:MAG: aminotransferase class I/II-fold pyridoxal phosphate-dependent enzyme [Calditrichales bacterium]
MKFRTETDIVHGILHSDPTGAHSMPIYQTSTFVFENADQGARRFKKEESGYIYSRLGNPNTDALGEKLAVLEGCEAGLTTASGMAAVSNVILTAARTGDHIIVDETVYGGTHYLVEDEIKNMGISVTRCDTRYPDQVKKALRANTKLVLIETPANPTLKLIDIAKVAEITRDHPALLAVDNTFLTPYLQQPVKLGADIVLHSATKYISGHGDVVAGIIGGPASFIKKAYKVGTSYGWTMSPFNAWLLLRGLKTLAVRMDRQCDNALHLAEWLESHPKIERVYYPFLPSHPQYELAKKQQKSGGGVISFELKGGFDAGKTLMNNVKLHALAVSLGDCDSLIQHPPSMTHAGMSAAALKEAHIAPGLVRISVGLEHIEDLKADLDQALMICK